MNVMTRYIQERFKFWVYIPLSVLLAIGSEFSGLYYLNKVEIIKRILTAVLYYGAEVVPETKPQKQQYRSKSPFYYFNLIQII